MINSELTPKKLKVFKTLGVPYTDADIANASAAVEGKTQMDAMIAYLQVLGTVIPHGSEPRGGN